MSNISNYLCRLMFICLVTLSLSACIVETEFPLFSLDDAVTPIANSSLLVVTGTSNPEYIPAEKKADDTYSVKLIPAALQLTASFHIFPDKAGYFVMQVESSEELGEFSYFLAAIDGNQLTVTIGDKLDLPEILSKQQLFSYFSEILSSGEIEIMQFTLYDLGDDEQAAAAKLIVEQMDEKRKISSGTASAK